MKTELSPTSLQSFKGYDYQTLQQAKELNYGSRPDAITHGSLPASAYRANYLTKVSFTRNNTLDENLKLAREAVEYVKNLKLISSTRLEMDGRKTEEDYDNYESAVSNAMFVNRKRAGLAIEEYVAFTNKTCPLMRFGNCSDQAILAATYLKEQKDFKNFALIAAFEVTDQKAFEAKPLKYVFNTDNHVFLVLGLAPDAKLNDPATWGSNAVIVDSWGDICAPALMGGIEQEKKIPLFRSRDKVQFMNYAPFIDPSKDQESAYNWENYQRKLKR